jgi:hypothetical protein
MNINNDFVIFRDKTRIARGCDQFGAHYRARQDALKERGSGRNPVYLIVGTFGDGIVASRIGKLSHGGMHWKFAE